ncbi:MULTISPECIES: FAS1-like dehydratase domain-containing protein [Allobranchiibius]|uniref:Acyl dehydratase n=1 Tax=Allobranchiibius huperziae TaxID=1874116 RepID=A0A853DMA8_9MICO|nr:MULTISPECIES: MaoC family dehydratase N-terminal domain-containing protein [Allobranchiibius]MBO1767790.1 MaoC family dehydratase N-terminal domain-containing protein [Allobranchiibius sp. GilTou38]NYJ75760.1 acyl dehydratase [Allobranchiibius huperziae]UIJ36100.1 MaoC family dehydratase N-terminal domain-containing protein [Allobranchiibius sp. GilTou73]
MAVNPQVEGRTYPPTDPYVVSRAKIAEFAAAVGARDAAHTDVAEAGRRGYADVVAPPTYAIGISQSAEAAAILDPEADIDYSRVVHGEQKFTHHRPLVAGDEVVAQTTIARVRAAGGHSMVTLETQIKTTGGDLTTTATSLLVIRGGGDA